MHIPFICMVKFKFLAHFPVDHLADSVMSGLVLLLCQFATIAYYVSSLSLLLLSPFEVFTSASTDGLSLEFERQQVSSSFQDSSQYSGRSL